MKLGLKLWKQNRLATYWLDGRKRVKQGKRVSYKRCPITREEHRAYIEHGSAVATAMVRKRLNCSLLEAWETMKRAMHGAW